MESNKINRDFSKILSIAEKAGLVLHTYPTEYRVACPICQSESTSNPALSIYFDGHYFCHSCNKHGPITKLAECLGLKLEVIATEETTKPSVPAKKLSIDPVKIYSIARALSKDQFATWLKRRGFQQDQIKTCINIVEYDRLRYREYRGEKSLIVPIISTGLCGIERINFERDKLKPKSEEWNKKALGKKSGLFYLPVKDSKGTIITESLANSCVNALTGFNSLVTFGIGNTKLIPEAVAKLRQQGHTVYYWPDSLGIDQEENKTREAKMFWKVLKDAPGLRGILWSKDVKHNFDINDLLILANSGESEIDFAAEFKAMLEASFTFEEYTSEKKRLEAIEELKPEISEKPAITEKTLTAIKEAFWDYSAKVKILSASTGVGKTHEACVYAYDIAKDIHFKKICLKQAIHCQGVTLLCSTIAEAEKTVQELKGIMPEESYKWISLVISDSELEGEEEKGETGGKPGLIAVSTYGYLNFKGETDHAYIEAKNLLQGRIVICDECQSLWEKTVVMFALANNYKRHNDGETCTYKEFSKCPKNAKKGNCQECRLGFKRDAATGTPKERHFPKSVSEKAFPEIEEMPRLSSVLRLVDCLDITSYSQVFSTLFFKPVETFPDVSQLTKKLDFLYRSKESNGQPCTYQQWVEILLEWTDNAHLRIESPIERIFDERSKEVIEMRPLARKEIQKRLEQQEELKNLQCPIQACFIPFLSGRNLLPFLQLLQAKVLMFMSATVPDGMRIFLQNLAQKFHEEVKEFEVTETPYKFHVTCLKMAKKLSLDKQAQFIKAFSKEHLFVATARESEVDAIYKSVRRLGNVAVFKHKDYFWESEQTSQIKGVKNVILTYVRSAICKGMNFPEIVIVLIDCNQFLPKIALDELNPLMSKEEIIAKMIREISENIKQIVGRFFRSLLTRMPGATVIDTRQIVIGLHGLPEELQEFSIDEKLLASYQEYRNDQFLSSLPRFEMQSLIEAIKLARERQSIPDRKKIDHDLVLEKAIVEGMNSIHSEERSLLTLEDLRAIKEEKEKREKQGKEESIEARLRKLKAEGKGWNDASRALNIHRLSKLEKSRLKYLWKKL